MNQTEILQQQLDYNIALVEKLKPYYAREVKDLPNDVIKLVQNIKFGPKITTSGIESITSVLESLYVANYYLESAIDNPQQFLQLHSNNPTKKSDQPDATKINLTPPTNKPDDKIISIKPENSSPTVTKPISNKKITINLNPTNKQEDTTPPQITKIEL